MEAIPTNSPVGQTIKEAEHSAKGEGVANIIPISSLADTFFPRSWRVNGHLDASITKLVSLLEATHSYDLLTSQSIRLIPTEGLMSPLQKLMYQGLQHERYLHAPPENHDKAIRYPDIGQLQDIYGLCRAAAKTAFDAEYILPDYLSGMNCMNIALMALSKPHDLVLIIDPHHGGHESTPQMLSDLGRKYLFLPFDIERHVIDVTKLDSTLKPQLIYLNHSNTVYTHNLEGLKNSYPDAVILFDGSQVMGLIAGKAYPNPLLAGADVLIGSTHKSLNGPQKALSATNNIILHQLLEQKVRTYISNNHPAATAALAVCLIEANCFGINYAQRVLNNTRILANALTGARVKIYPNRLQKQPPDTQHLWIDCASMGWEAEEAVQALNKAGLVVNTLFLCGAGPKGAGAKGLRLGTTEVTRLGMGAKEMEIVAHGIASVLSRQVNSETVKNRMMALRSKYQNIKYCFETGEQLTNWFKQQVA